MRENQVLFFIEILHSLQGICSLATQLHRNGGREHMKLKNVNII